ncbi:porin [Alkalimonas collagenimarina]|uniref:Porin n=1 Tax=Alkalimonas collagenimarina TaxID=400390 RepID=A0ABT9GX56_9GAMM|nr:porin [Alkalimonas collagenimarina]MDP4535449.1 porin [Alkalimonas collagenimarina]
MKTMRISLIAAALTSTLAVPAMANDINVKVSGRAHLSVDHLNDGEDSGLNVSSNSSRLRFAANTQVTEGLEVVMQLEQNIRYDQSGGNFSTRDSFLGLRGDFGLARVGFFDTPLKAVRSRTDMFGDRIGDARNITSGPGMSFDNRYRNGIHYRSPAMSGFTFDFQYTPHNANDATVDNDNESFSTSFTYNANGLYAAIAYETYENAAGDDPNALRLGVSYDVSKQLKVSALYQNASNLVGGDRNVWGVGASYKMEDYTFRGQFYQAGDNDLADSGANMFVVGVDRSFGRALTMYLAYGLTSNDDAAAFTIASGGRDTRLPAIAGENSSGLSLGMIYNF